MAEVPAALSRLLGGRCAAGIVKTDASRSRHGSAIVTIMTLLRSIVTLGAAASAILVPLLGGHALATGEAGGAVFALATFAAAAALCFLQSRLPGGETPRRSH